MEHCCSRSLFVNLNNKFDISRWNNTHKFYKIWIDCLLYSLVKGKP